MAGYTPLFSTLTTGTLCGRWPDIGLWPIVLSLCDKNGHVDVTPMYLAGVTGLSVDDVVACMRRFCEPDPYSRSSDANGARLVLLDEHREWGWLVVNHAKYREKARKSTHDSQRVITGQNAARMAQRRQDPTRPDATRVEPLSDSDANTDADSDKDIRSRILALKSKYPKAAREDWITAEKRIRQLVSDGTSWESLEEGVERYQRYCEATSRMVQNPANWFGSVDRPWLQGWALPDTKADKRLKSNLSAAEEFMRRTETT